MIHEARIALEWFLASGPRTSGRLVALVREQCALHAYPNEESIQVAIEEAQRSVKPWQWDSPGA